jgi:hypothetical protein
MCSLFGWCNSGKLWKQTFVSQIVRTKAKFAKAILAVERLRDQYDDWFRY